MIRTARLTLTPVSGADLPDLIAIKSDPLVYAQMLGGLRTPWQTIDELTADTAFWAANSIGMFAIRAPYAVRFGSMPSHAPRRAPPAVAATLP